MHSFSIVFQKVNNSVFLCRENFVKSATEPAIVEVRESAESLRKGLSQIENQLTQNQYETPSDRLRHPTMLKERMEALVSVVSVSDAAPPRQAHAVYEELCKLIDNQITQLKQLEEDDLLRLNKQIEQAGIPKLQA